jgi:hypothetical protein
VEILGSKHDLGINMAKPWVQMIHRAGLLCISGHLIYFQTAMGFRHLSANCKGNARIKTAQRGLSERVRLNNK